ncbi:hypothetical protein SynBOUM118_02227 [Synechococcus sp. BOUM118]|nr:hypothetical protein SynBOUM118_02227 [Synechococcus sp. BOUM118]
MTGGQQAPGSKAQKQYRPQMTNFLEAKKFAANTTAGTNPAAGTANLDTRGAHQPLTGEAPSDTEPRHQPDLVKSSAKLMTS